MDHGHGDMGMMNNSSGAGAAGGPAGMMHRHKMMMHMTFFWGSKAEILFDKWPGNSSGMYVLALVFVFVLAILVEWLSHSQLIKPGTNHVVAGFVQTLMHTLRVGINYLVMLAVMSFNGGIFLAVVAGHSLGFLIFGSRVFKKNNPPLASKTSDLPPMTC